MPVLIVLGVLGLVALALIYWALAFCARESGPAGKALAAGLAVAITGLAAWAIPLFLFLLAAASCPPGAHECPV